MGYVILDPQPGPRDEALGYDEAGEGLYPGETAIRLDSGHLVAVSIDQERLETGEGIALKACGRWIKGDGETRMDALGKHIEANFSHTANVGDLTRLGLGAIQKEMILALLGEPPTEVDVHVDETAEPPADLPKGAVLDPTNSKAALIPWSDEVRLNASIRRAIASAKEATPQADLSAIL